MKRQSAVRSAWIQGPLFDGLGILLPPFLGTGIAIAAYALGYREVGPIGWLLFVVGIDVAHVYATLFRTYWNREEREAHATLLTFAPLVAWSVGVFLYSLSPLSFWRGLAYFAAFHFVRQQYGFFTIYARRRGEKVGPIDRAVIYLSMIYPLIYWHTQSPRHFRWFVDGDFLRLSASWLAPLVLALWGASLGLYLYKEARARRAGQAFNLPKQLVLLGTALSWNAGIVWFNNDLVFTLTNVVGHGVPYLALAWWYSRRYALAHGEETWLGRWRWQALARPVGLLLYLGVVWVLAYAEEGLWDGFVWREHLALFPWAQGFPGLPEGGTLTWLVPLLTLPQSTHYLIDGFLWRRKGAVASLRLNLFPERATA